eukprot:CAMPEP_0197309604 /NCGR_PEP_ID=MMETSP0891-20130614/8181_1 /TAXON_ID=44058 ORGANISM="Aureoumbra lagunensis, Strain CCMP1510" /NCGR_SAMPLE_ID=MMETSP0891 /ASSEMBLY_ACC=CAM_ASM_000534 /LENGTH=1574 /DNA_ID=CAMNT_0042794765 /DNA_START=127 /DNA_END=4851 /DNA_ORIENTATION=+
MAKVALVLEDGSVFFGKSFGAPIKEKSLGEAVFQTGMVGYAEALTDPSYRGQLLAMTFPMIGNYGVPAYAEDENGLPVKTFESKHIHASALIVQEYSAVYSHWEANRSLGEWLAEENVPGICEVDTRRLAKLLRERGSMLGAIVPHAESETALKKLAPQLAKEAKEYLATRHLVDEVSCTDSPRIYKPTNTQEKARVLAIDCGIKANMVRELNKRGVQVTVLRWNEAWATNGLMDQYDGVFLSNGPGDPTACDATIAQIKSALSRADPTTVRPIFGICLGNQLVGLAAGAETKKLRFGNRGQNQPCIDAKNGECFVTSQNHGYAVDDTKLPTGWSTLYTNANDGSNEGLIHDSLPYFTAQFHPEANGGPNDAAFLFDVFVDACINYRQVRQGIIMETKFPALRFENSLHAVQPMKQSHEFPKKVLLLGSGGLSIGQAGEFDYSGAQAIKALKEEGVEVVLMNPNIASVQTNVDPSSTAAQRRADPSAADHVFFIPVTPAFVEQVIIREKPDAILISMGGQTALNCGIELHNKGIFAKYGVRVLGTQIDAVVATEDREIFKNELAKIGEPVATSVAVTSVKDALEAAENVTGYPCMARAAFALGGLGSGIVQDAEQLEKLARKALAVSPQLLIEKSMLGWKEVEYEVVRDSADNCITVCNMENFDPLGVHTGDSMVIAPSQTLSNDEYHFLRDAALRVVRHLGIVGECNIQYALHPTSKEYAVIEVNPRLSRSSALASKATGYPLAFVAAKLAMGVHLPQLRNKVTGGATTACFEPALDYCVVKVPRWDLGKFQGAHRVLGSAMASVGEVMAIGRTFEEAFQKALRMVDPGFAGFEPRLGEELTDDDIRIPTDGRIWKIAQALYRGASGDSRWGVDAVHDLSKIDKWFLSRLFPIATASADENLWKQLSQAISSTNDISCPNLKEQFLRLKKLGFSDKQIATRCNATETAVRTTRLSLGVEPCVKQIDTLAGEFAAATNYLYTTYHGDEDDDDDDSARAHRGGRKMARGGVLVLGSGPYRIGSSVEFDWCAVSAMRALRAAGARGIMINCNPETVSTDYDECDALYFEELSLERVLDVYDREGVDVGVVVSMGGQIPQNLAVPLDKAGAHVLGTRPAMIDAAEDRSKFSALMDKAGVKQPRWAELESEEAAITFAKSVGYPVLVRPSYVLSGAAMAVCRDEQGLLDHLHKAKDVSKEHPVVVSKFVRGARELEVDAVAKDGQVICAALHEHIEDAGVHSGDATLMLPPQTLSAYALQRARDATREIAKSLQISGPLNVQFLIGGREGPPGSNELDGSFESMNAVRVIECNLRASRSVPFVSKSTGVDFADVATRVLAGYPVAPTDPDHPLPPLYPSSTEHIRPKNFVAVKAPMFSFARLRGADPTLGVEMASTGEVACFGADAHEAFLKAYLSTNTKLPKKGDAVLLSFAAPYAHRALAPAYQLYELGYRLYATQNTADYLNQRSVPCEKVAFPTDESTQDALDAAEVLKDGSVRLVVNLHSPESQRLADNYLIRRTAADYHIALITNTQLFETLAIALARHNHGDFLALKPASLFHHYKMEKNEDAWTDVDEFH